MMMDRNEHNHIVDTLIKRIEQLEKQLRDSKEATDIVTAANNNKAIKIMHLEKEIAAKDNIIKMFKGSNERKQKQINNLRKKVKNNG